MAFVTSSGRRW